MSQPNLPDRIVDQLRANLRAAGISAAESDIQGIIEKGFLSRLPTIEQILDGVAADDTPDYLVSPHTPSPSPLEGEGEHVSGIEQPLPFSLAWETSEAQRAGWPGGEGAYATLAQGAELIRTRQLSPAELVEQMLERIARRDPALNAYQIV